MDVGSLEERSRPVRGAWIETARGRADCSDRRGRALYGARGLKHPTQKPVGVMEWSRPVRGAWIETNSIADSGRVPPVAPCTGRVD